MMLSSDTEQMTQGSLGFQEKSEIFAVCPPCMNYSEMLAKKIKNKTAVFYLRLNQTAVGGAEHTAHQELGRTIFSIFSRLLFPNFAAKMRS